MFTVPLGSALSPADRLLPYIAELEMEVDRLRRQASFVERATCDALQSIRRICVEQGSVPAESPYSAIESLSDGLSQIVRDLHEHPGYHPAHDQVTAVAIRPLAEQIFRWQQRLCGATHAKLHLGLKTEHVDWFPARLRHILDGLFSRSLHNRSSSNGETRVTLDVQRVGQAYELRVSDNGLKSSPLIRSDSLLFAHVAAVGRDSRLEPEMAAVALLVEQSGGTITVERSEDSGTCYLVQLPRYDAGDFLDPS